jgi:hypothetical protein
MTPRALLKNLALHTAGVLYPIVVHSVRTGTKYYKYLPQRAVQLQHDASISTSSTVLVLVLPDYAAASTLVPARNSRN